jgi:hypothetical protein
MKNTSLKVTTALFSFFDGIFKIRKSKAFLVVIIKDPQRTQRTQSDKRKSRRWEEV